LCENLPIKDVDRARQRSLKSRAYQRTASSAPSSCKIDCVTSCGLAPPVFRGQADHAPSKGLQKSRACAEHFSNFEAVKQVWAINQHREFKVIADRARKKIGFLSGKSAPAGPCSISRGERWVRVFMNPSSKARLAQT